MDDVSEPFDLDFRPPQLSGTNSRGASLVASPSPSLNNERSGLPLLQLDDWNPDVAYSEHPHSCIYYSLEWKLQLRKGRLSMIPNDTERNLVPAPGAFWGTILEAKAERLRSTETENPAG